MAYPWALKDALHFISNLHQEAKHIHVAERCVPTQKRRNALSTLAPPFFFSFETPELDAELVHIVAMYCTHVLRWVGSWDPWGDAGSLSAQLRNHLLPTHLKT